jgi:hypothetical protein
MLMLGLGSSVWHNGKGKKSIADKPGGCRSSVSGKGADEALGTCHRVGSAGAARDAGKERRGWGRDAGKGRRGRRRNCREEDDTGTVRVVDALAPALRCSRDISRSRSQRLSYT